MGRLLLIWIAYADLNTTTEVSKAHSALRGQGLKRGLFDKEIMVSRKAF